MTSIPVQTGRLSTGVPGLDAMVGGGFLPGDATLVAGSPGTGKTTLGLHFLAAGVKAGEPGIFVTFEYLPQQIYRDALKKGWPLQQWEAENRVRLVCTTPDILLAEGDRRDTILDGLIRDLGAKRLVIDSMSHFEFHGPSGGDLRERLAGLVNHLRLLKVTTLMTHEIAQIIGPTVTLSNYGLEFLADNLIILRYVELGGEMQKACNVLKFRGGAHDRKYRRLDLTDQGIAIQSDFAGVENISGGSARRSVQQRAQELI
jgi:circadian clock protein KaiC